MSRYLVLCIFSVLIWKCFAIDRNYFVAADEVVWDYAPTGKDGVTGMPFSSMEMMDPASMWVTQSAQRYEINTYCNPPPLYIICNRRNFIKLLH